MHTIFGFWTDDDFVVIEQADCEWHVKDLLRRDETGPVLVGGIHFVGEKFVAIATARPDGSRRCASLQDAVRFLIGTVARGDRVLQAGLILAR